MVPRILLTFDPGKTTGWAMFRDGKMVDCSIVEDSKYSTLLGITAAPQGYYQKGEALIVIENQEIYPHSKVDPNDLIKLAHKAGRLAGLFEVSCFHIEMVLPKVWKGQVPKDVHHRRCLSVLHDDEQRLLKEAQAMIKSKSKVLDLNDAVCLGLWRLGRAR